MPVEQPEEQDSSGLWSIVIPYASDLSSRPQAALHIKGPLHK